MCIWPGCRNAAVVFGRNCMSSLLIAHWKEISINKNKTLSCLPLLLSPPSHHFFPWGTCQQPQRAGMSRGTDCDAPL